MCTLTYVPSLEGSIITTNRDESARRNASSLESFENSSQQLFLIAKEPIHGGTNLAISQDPNAQMNVLLNGAFEPHAFGKSYRMSRGLIMLESLDVAKLSVFSTYSLEDIEPFTLVRFGKEIEELRWDGKKHHYCQYNINEPRIWSSAQLYSKEIIKQRESWFEELLGSKPWTAEVLADFHHRGGNGDIENDLVMNRRNRVQTVSITQLVNNVRESQIHHWNLVDKKTKSFRF